MQSENKGKSESKFAVGVDAGGTTIRVALADRQGEVFAIADAVADPAGGPEPVRALLRQLLTGKASESEVASVCAGATKLSRVGVRAAWEAMLAEEFPQAWRSVVPDYEIALHGALPGGVGVVVIAGTGSVAFGVNAAGETARVGGRGWEYGDEGSGAWLTTEMIKRTLRACDGLQAASPLTDAVCDLLQATDAALVGERARQRAAEHGRGFLTPLALARAQAGDREAANLFVGAGGWLALLVRVTGVRLGWKSAGAEPISVALLGGIAEAGDWVVHPFATVLARNFPAAIIVKPDSTALVGAVRLAARGA